MRDTLTMHANRDGVGEDYDAGIAPDSDQADIAGLQYQPADPT